MRAFEETQQANAAGSRSRNARRPDARDPDGSGDILLVKQTPRGHASPVTAGHCRSSS